jgi:hypothetical protein
LHRCIYSLAHCLMDRDGGVIGCNLPKCNNPLFEQAPDVGDFQRTGVLLYVVRLIKKA